MIEMQLPQLRTIATSLSCLRKQVTEGRKAITQIEFEEEPFSAATVIEWRRSEASRNDEALTSGAV